MSKHEYSKEVCDKLFKIANNPILKIGYRRTRYESGDKLNVEIESVFPAVRGLAIFGVEKFIGGGFAGQVYRCRLEKLEISGEKYIKELELGKLYAIKINVPPSGFSLWFRNVIYWIAFQGPFGAQHNLGACRSGLLLQKLIRRGAKLKFGRETAVKDAIASFYDPQIGSYGEITEWIEGRMWLLETDWEMKGRKEWKTIQLDQTGSPEYIAKRRFMSEMKNLLHEMGAIELARQYEWWTMKSQTNSIKRTDILDSFGPGNGLCAIDFRSGLALLPFFPMSPVDFKLIFEGLVRGSIVQFDRCDTRKMREFFEKNYSNFSDLQPAIEEFFRQNEFYRRSVPDIAHQGTRLFYDSGLRNDVKNGLIGGYFSKNIIDNNFFESLKNDKFRFFVFYLLGIFPIVGKFIRKIWGNRIYREHFLKIFSSSSYINIFLKSHVAGRLIDWYRAGRIDERHIEFLLRFPFFFTVERIMLGFLPSSLHIIFIRPLKIWHKIRNWLIFIKKFINISEFREKWFLNEIELGKRDGMITEKEFLKLKNSIRDPFVVNYLRCLGIHFSSVIITRLVGISAGLFLSAWVLFDGHSWAESLTVFGLTLIFFQLIPISPGSLFRGGFVIYMMIKEKNIKNYIIAAPVSFLKYVGYLAFPLQMVASYPHLARFMASRWSTNIAHHIPVFGEKGALLEHWVFDIFFNYPQKIFRWLKFRIHFVLDGWMIFGFGIITSLFYFWPLKIFDPKIYINIILFLIVIFIFPRIVFYPIIKKRIEEENPVR